jgi:hypothetical protein
VSITLTTGILLIKITDFKSGFWLKTFLLHLFFSVLLLCEPLSAQSDFNRRIDFQASGEKLTSVLGRLSANENLNFSFNPGDKSFDVIVNYKTTNTPLQTVLKEILILSGHDFRIIGGQIAIFSTSENNTPSRPAVVPQPVIIPVQEPDTAIEKILVPIRDTILLRDTIIRVDTIFVHDTIIVEKEVPRSVKPERPTPLKENMFRFEADRNNGWSIMPFYSHMVAFNILKSGNGDDELLRLTNLAESNWWFNQSLGAEVRVVQNKWHISSGLNYTRFTNRFNYNYTLTEGGFFRKDTTDIYYTIPQMDTIWHYVTDSTWVPVNSLEHTFNRLNRLGYIEIPLYIGYNIYSDGNFRVWVNAGINLGFLLHKNGAAIQSNGEYSGIEFNELDFKPLVLSYAFAGGMRYRVNEWVDVDAGVFYRQHLQSVLRNSALEKRVGALGLKVGIVYYL